MISAPHQPEKKRNVPLHKKRKELTVLMYILYFKEKIPKNGQHFLLDKQHFYTAKISRRNKSAWHARNRYCNSNIYFNCTTVQLVFFCPYSQYEMPIFHVQLFAKIQNPEISISFSKIPLLELELCFSYKMAKKVNTCAKLRRISTKKDQISCISSNT